MAEARTRRPGRAPRVMLVTHSYRPERTPPARRWAAVVSALRADGWEVDVVTPGGLRTVLGEDVVVATLPALPTIVAGRALALLRRRPLVVEMRDAWPDLAHEAGVHQGLLGAAMERVVTGGQRAADVVVTVTEGFAETLRGRGMRRVVALGNGVDVDRVPVAPPRERAPGELHVLYLGNLGESQGLERLVEAAARLRGTHPGVRVRIVGGGTRRTALQELDARLSAGVEFLDAVPGARVPEHYAWADTLVVCLRPDWPSFRHTVPSKTYEVLASGRHVTGQVAGEAARILQDAGGVADVIGPMTEDLAAFLTALADEPARTRVGDIGRVWVRGHGHLPTIARRYETLLRGLLAPSALCEPGSRPCGAPALDRQEHTA